MDQQLLIQYVVFISAIIIPIALVLKFRPQQEESSYTPEIIKCESPIERKLYNGLIQHQIYPVTQYKVGRYRLDFAIPSQKICIEADGKAYHSSPKQKAHDRKRDAYLKDKGWTVLRFTGRSIYRDLPGVVKKVKEYL